MLVARADGLGSTCSLPAGGFLLRVGVDAQRPVPRKAGADLGRVERQHGLQVTRLQERWQVAVELGIDRLDDRLARQLPRRGETSRWVRSAPHMKHCGKQRRGSAADYTRHGALLCRPTPGSLSKQRCELGRSPCRGMERGAEGQWSGGMLRESQLETSGGRHPTAADRALDRAFSLPS